MSEIQIMNSDILEILKNYLEICSFFNEKLDEIKADEILNINLQLLKASIIDLNINIANFKSYLNNTLEINQSKQNNQQDTHNDNNQHNLHNLYKSTVFSEDNHTKIDKKKMLALLFMYLMQIDKDSIINQPNFASIKNTGNSKTNKLCQDNKIYDISELD